MLNKEEIAELKRIKNNRKRVEKWLIANQDMLNVNAIERKLGLPKGLIQKFLKYDTKIHDKWINSVHDFLKELRSFQK